jgi:Holliday junction resolvase RusA-like endonuclease
MKFTIEGRLDGLNEYTKVNRSNRYLANSVKHKNQKLVRIAIKQAKLEKVINYPIMLKITWYEQNKRRDIDNITFATKFIQDELVNSGIIENDSQKYINKLEHDVKIDKDNPRIEVEIIENKI